MKFCLEICLNSQYFVAIVKRSDDNDYFVSEVSSSCSLFIRDLSVI